VNTANPAGTLILLGYLRNNVGDISSVTSSRAGESWTYTYGARPAGAPLPPSTAV
jgi:hypothetical protein